MGRKDFNKGMEAGASPFEDKFRQMGNQFHEFSDKMERDVDRIKDTNEAILDEMDSMQKKQFYKANTAVDISVLDKGDRETLLSLLFTLAETKENVNEYQQLFIRSVKKYLEKTCDEKLENGAVLKDGDWSVIETIVGIDETKAIAQAVMEFLFLGYGNHEEYFQEYEDLFECFCLNRKGFGEIMERIDNIYHATGLEGIAENYGYVPEMEESNENVPYGCYGDLAREEIKTDITIADNEEKLYEEKELLFSSGIKLGKNARLIFKNCAIKNDDLTNWSVLNSGIQTSESQSSIAFVNCTIEWNVKDEEIAFIQAYKPIKVVFEKCHIKKCKDFTEFLGDSSSVEIRDSCVNLLEEEEKNRRKRYFIEAHNIQVENSVFEAEKGDTPCIYKSLFCASKNGSKINIKGCSFHDITGVYFDAQSSINESEFENCTLDTMSNLEVTEAGFYKNCTFQKCVFEETNQNRGGVLLKFKNVKMSECVGVLDTTYLEEVESDGGCLVIVSKSTFVIKNCHFSNWSYDEYEGIKDHNGKNFFKDSSLYDYDQKSVYQLSIVAEQGGEISGCAFKNLHTGRDYLIGLRPHSTPHYQIINCTFSDIHTNSGEILKKVYQYEESYGFLGRKTKVVREEAKMDIRNCIGI